MFVSMFEVVRKTHPTHFLVETIIQQGVLTPCKRRANRVSVNLGIANKKEKQ
jgi:hypothetical protein